jgi:hypothetical protein
VQGREEPLGFPSLPVSAPTFAVGGRHRVHPAYGNER